MTLEDAKLLIPKIWGPDSGVDLRKTDKACEVVAKDGSVLGRAFGWDAALKQAALPVMKARAQEENSARIAHQADVLLFMQFLREKYHEDFEQWKDAHDPDKRSGDEASAPERAKADPGQLVQIVSR
jgi:hypothetical protein